MSVIKQLARILPPWMQRSLRRRYYLRVVQGYGEADWEWTPYVKPLIKPGATVIDIGANVGYLSGLFARFVGPAGRVVSVEPIPATYDALASSMRRLYADRVTTIQSCVSDQEGPVTMAVPDYEGGGANYYESRIVKTPEAAGAHFTVPATTLDALILNLNPNPIALIKIDVEGHELAVIQSGRQLFSTRQPPLLIEVAGNPDEAGSSAAHLFEELSQYGYIPHLIKDARLTPRTQGDQSVDYLFVKQE